MKKATVLAFAILLALPAAAAPIYMLENDLFRTSARLDEAARIPGGANLAPGSYDVEIKSLGGETVLASFFDKSGRKLGEAKGKVVPGAARAHGTGGGGGAGKATFQDIHFTPQSPTSFARKGNNLNFLITNPGGDQILIGLLFPAVQKAR